MLMMLRMSINRQQFQRSQGSSAEMLDQINFAATPSSA
jgi:hypothetical protein